MALTNEQLDSVLAEISDLEAQHRDDLKTFMGGKPPNAAAWTGAGIVQAQKIRSRLGSNPAVPGLEDKWSEAWRRVSMIAGG